MRRPLKPFVTEYKAGHRRSKDGPGGFGSEPDGLTAVSEAGKGKTAGPKNVQPTLIQPKPAEHRSGHKSSEVHPSDGKASSIRQAKSQPGRRANTSHDGHWANETTRFSSAQTEDSYEAAMRAADALFSGASSRPNQTPDQASSDQSQPTNQALPINQASPTKDVFASPPAEAPSPTSGRILQAIDKPSDTILAEMEAERAPKRRGRKPGSKNKPKIQAATPNRPALDPVFDEDDGVIPFPDLPLAPLPGHATPPLPFTLAFPMLSSRDAPRFGWVRTKLGPGEQWKRRLPKVIW